MFGLNTHEIIKAVKPKRVIGKGRLFENISRISLDTRTLKKGQGFIALKGNNFDAHNFLDKASRKKAAFLIAEHIPLKLKSKLNIPVILVKDTTRALGSIAKSLRAKYKPRVCAVTGSLGKTTTKDMIAHILRDNPPLVKNKSSENNHIGLPKTLLDLKEYGTTYILELGTNHFGEIAYLTDICNPEISVLTCIDNVHLEYFKDKQGVFKEKSSLFKVNPLTQAVLNADDPFTQRLKTKIKPIYFGSKKSNDISFDFIRRQKGAVYFRINSEYNLKINNCGIFNIYNAMAALGCCLALGKNLKHSVKKLSGFKFPYMRMEPKILNSTTFINDAYNSNPRALKEALESVRSFKSRRKIGVLADMLELGAQSFDFHKAAVKQAYNSGFNYIIFLGEHMKKAGKSVKAAGRHIPETFYAEDIKAAKYILKKIIRKGDLVFIKGSRQFRLEKIIPLRISESK